MSVIVDKKFYDSLPKEVHDRAVSRIEKFIEELERNNHLIQKLTKGFYCRKVKGVENRYKFRVSNGDRVVFCYQRGHQDICLLRYCNHDSQIFVAKAIQETPLKIVDAYYKKDSFDVEIDKKILEEYQKSLLGGDLESAYKIASDVGAGMERKAKFLNGAIKIEKFVEAYHSHKAGTTGIAFDTEEKAYLTESVLLHVFQKIEAEYHLIPVPYLEVSFPGQSFFKPGPHFLDQPFFAILANREKDTKSYLKALAHEIYQTFGLITSAFSFSLEMLFWDHEDALIAKSFRYTISTNELKEADNVTIRYEDHNNRMNSYVRALTLATPEKIRAFNFKYLFSDSDYI